MLSAYEISRIQHGIDYEHSVIPEHGKKLLAHIDAQAQTIAALTEFHRLCWLIWSDYANGGDAVAALERLDRALTQSDAALAAATPKEGQQ